MPTIATTTSNSTSVNPWVWRFVVITLGGHEGVHRTMPNERAHLKSRAAGARTGSRTLKEPAHDPRTGQRLEVQRLVLLRLYAVVSSHPQIPGRSGGCRRRSAKALAHQRATRCYAQVPWRCG